MAISRRGKQRSESGGRRQSAAALRQSERKYRELVEHANCIILHWTHDGRITFLNEFGQRFFGYAEEEILGRHVVGTIVPETESTGRDLRPLMNQICSDPTAFERNVNENVRRNGERVWIDWTNKVDFDDDGQVAGILSIGADVTERKRAEQELRRLNRALQTLSQCNQALVHAEDETELLNAICRIAVETGGYRLAWVGRKEHDEAKTVRPIAHAGCDEGYLERLDVAWADTERGRGPTGVAIRTGQAVVARRLSTEPDFAPWIVEADRRGFAASLALPLAAGGEVRGALNIYSDDPDAFDADEYKLLSELADDLAYGVAALRARAARARFEDELRKSEGQLSLVLNHVFDVIFAIAVEPDDEFRFAWVNRRFLEVTGLTENQIVGARAADVIPKPAQALVFGKYREAIRRGQAARWEEVSEYPAGRRHGQVTVVPVCDARGVCTQLVGMVHDITEQKSAQEEAELSAKYIRYLSQYANDFIILLDEQFRFLEVNDRVVDFYGYTREELNGMHASQLRAPETKADFLSQAKTAETARTTVYETVHRRKDGGAFPVEVSLRAIDVEGKRFYQAIIRDIAERKLAEQEVRKLNDDLRRHAEALERRVAERTAELAAAKERAESADRLKSAFLAAMSHELRTPLNSIIGFTGIILQGLAGPLNDEQKKQLTMVQNSARHLLSLINDVLDISKIEAGQLVLTEERFDLRPSIEKMVELVSPMAKQKNLTLRLDISDDIGALTTDQRRFEQIVLNLLNNAVKFTDKGQVHVSCRNENRHFLMTIADTGVGMRSEELPRLFQPFHQVDSGLTRKYEGTGLGLSICKKLLDKMGGSIGVESELGKGSVFTVLIPRQSGGAR